MEPFLGIGLPFDSRMAFSRTSTEKHGRCMSWCSTAARLGFYRPGAAVRYSRAALLDPDAIGSIEPRDH